MKTEKPQVDIDQFLNTLRAESHTLRRQIDETLTNLESNSRIVRLNLDESKSVSETGLGNLVLDLDLARTLVAQLQINEKYVRQASGQQPFPIYSPVPEEHIMPCNMTHCMICFASEEAEKLRNIGHTI